MLSLWRKFRSTKCSTSSNISKCQSVLFLKKPQCYLNYDYLAILSLPSTVSLPHFVQYLNFCPVSPLPFHFAFSIHFCCYLLSFCYTWQKTVLKHISYYQIYQVVCLECSNTTRIRIAITATVKRSLQILVQLYAFWLPTCSTITTSVHNLHLL